MSGTYFQAAGTRVPFRVWVTSHERAVVAGAFPRTAMREARTAAESDDQDDGTDGRVRPFRGGRVGGAGVRRCRLEQGARDRSGRNGKSVKSRRGAMGIAGVFHAQDNNAAWVGGAIRFVRTAGIFVLVAGAGVVQQAACAKRGGQQQCPASNGDVEEPHPAHGDQSLGSPPGGVKLVVGGLAKGVEVRARFSCRYAAQPVFARWKAKGPPVDVDAFQALAALARRARRLIHTTATSPPRKLKTRSHRVFS